ncbi:hypothetical protein CONPUDRAFT_84444 [Coniophora puteana RWD-64-598 SS2]|uniref:Uncharacterized protein n=1 Tax=Coniophora puteana (strain RWD-64-598) TaxID=741705 RepID=A0A5M3MDI6_CONPW|nr:uncharacterized protein CONPUDRAFT_84444 [Coniophora puteana RWD-64-598 SS2]EIW77322.1 hypothetical protein CONPUDRAFT_84444 [Coniophora puteana RWD-64-598 SS2]
MTIARRTRIPRNAKAQRRAHLSSVACRRRKSRTSLFVMMTCCPSASNLTRMAGDLDQSVIKTNVPHNQRQARRKPIQKKDLKIVYGSFSSSSVSSDPESGGYDGALLVPSSWV